MAETLINQTDSQGRKQGPWEETDEGYIEKGHYVDGLREGLWHKSWGKYFLEWEGYYLNGKKHGHWKIYSLGTLQGEGPCLDNMKHGHWKWYHEDGVIINTEGTYKDDKRHGLWKSYYEDGITLRRENHYRNGEQHGLCKWYREDGTLMECTLYNMDKQLPSSPLLLLLFWLSLP